MARRAPALAEPSLDGLRDEEVPRREAAVSERGRDNWKSFFAPHRPAAAVAAAAEPARRRAAAVMAQQLLTVGEHAALVKAGHTNSTASSSTAVRCPGGGSGNATTACGDETVDPLAGEAVQVKREEVHADPKEETVYSYFTARKQPAAAAAPAAARHAFKVGARAGGGGIQGAGHASCGS